MTRARLIAPGTLILLLMGAPPTAPAVELPEGFSLEQVASGLRLPTAMAFGPDGLILVTEKAGVVRTVSHGVLQDEPFLDLSNVVNSRGDRGLTGIDLHPDFPATPLVYLAYSYDPPGLPGEPHASDGPDGDGPRLSHVVHVTADVSTRYQTAVPETLTVLMGGAGTLGMILASDGSPEQPLCEDGGVPIADCLPSDSPAHGAGSVRFGPDGALYVGHGDGSNPMILDTRALRAQDLTTASGKLFRVDPRTGLGLPDNPFFDGDAATNQSKVWSYGLRNPFRYAFHPDSGEIYIGDVGWNSWEEINAGGGKNFGWPCWEGAVHQPAYENLDPTREVCLAIYENEETSEPLYYYRRPRTGGSLILGEFVTSAAYPPRYHGALFFGDYNDRWLRTLQTRSDGSLAASPFGFSVAAMVHMAQGPDGHLYLVAIDTDSIYRLVYNGANNPPTAVADASPESGAPALEVQFSSGRSTDPDGDPLSFEWDFGDGSTSTDPAPVHVFTEPGAYLVRLTATDGHGARDFDEIQIRAGVSFPSAIIQSPGSGTTYVIGETLTLRGSGSDPEDGALTGENLEWVVTLHHAGHEHPDWFRASGETTDMTITDHGDDTSLELTLVARDSGGLEATDTVVIHPRNASIILESSPQGMELVYENGSAPTPLVAEAPLGAERLIAAPPIQNHLSFTRWSDGGERSHAIAVDRPLRTLIAYYENRSPLAVPATSSHPSDPSLVVHFDGSRSSDPEGSPLTYFWDFGDGNTASGVAPEHQYAEAGAYMVSLTVTDVHRATNRMSMRIAVGFQSPFRRGVRPPTSGGAAQDQQRNRASRP